MRSISINFTRAVRSHGRMSAGFTVVEMIVVTVVLGITIGLLFGPLNDLYTANNKGLRTTVSNADNRSALQIMRQTVASSHSFSDTNDKVSDPSGNSWTGNSSTLITHNYATWRSGSERGLVKGGAGCEPLMNHYVFFVSGGVLYRRTLTANGIVPPCESVTWEQKQTCASGASNARCQGTDAKLLTNVESLEIEYFASSAGNDTAAPTAAKAIEVTLTQKTSNDTSPVTSKMRISRMNGN